MKIFLLEDDFWRSDSSFSFDCLEYLLHFHLAQLLRVTQIAGWSFRIHLPICEKGSARGMRGGWVGGVGSGLTAQKYLPLVLHGKYFSANNGYIDELAYICRLRIYVFHDAYSCLSEVISSESPKMDLQVWRALATYTMVWWPKVWYGVNCI